MVPECSSLVGCSKVIQEAVICSNRALVNKRGSVGPVCAVLQESVPVLKHKSILELIDSRDRIVLTILVD